MGDIVKKLGLNAVKAYQKYISKDYNGARHAHCMYSPSCSQYTLESIEDNGFSKGVVDGFFRLTRCNIDVKKVRIEQFFNMLNGFRYNISLPNLVFKDPETKDVVAELSEEIGYMNTVRTPKENCMQQEEIKKRLQKINIKTINTVGSKDEDMKFLLSLPAKDDSVSASCDDDKNVVCKAIENSSGLLSACGWGIAGGGIGLVVGMVLGAVVSWAAGDSKTENSNLDLLNNKLAEKYSVYSVIGMVTTERSIGLLNGRIEKFLENYMHNKRIASCIASIIGVPYGVLVGAIGGALISGSIFGKMGYYFGRNLIHDKLHRSKQKAQHRL